MGGKNGSHGKFALLEVEQTGSCHPFVELRHYMVVWSDIEAYEVIYDITCSIAEKCRLNIVPVAVERVHSKLFPEVGKYLVLSGDELCKVHQYGNGIAGYIPAADSHTQPLIKSSLAPGTE